MVTRLCSIHPYPAMIADPLAEQLANEFVSTGMRVLDPFCGTGRTLLAAAARGADCIGFDVNPHAILLVKAKSASYQISEIDEFIKEIDKCLWNNPITEEFLFERGRKVTWFSGKSKNELAELLILLNSRKRSENIKALAGAVLSATAREVSYCRNDRWKLHRISESKRKQPSPSAKAIFKRKLKSVANEIRTSPSLEGNCRSFIGDSRNLNSLLKSIKESSPFDLVITSPPYGDSRTTVQYGGMSSICLEAVSYISGFDHFRITGSEIDAKCIGGRQTRKNADLDFCHKAVSPYWKGGKKNKALKRTYPYLYDLKQVCIQTGNVLRKDGYAVIVVARRRVGHWRLYTDIFIEDVFTALGIKLVEKRSRKIKKKFLPRQIKPYARSKNSQAIVDRRISTMVEEFVLVFQRSETN